MGLFRNVAKVRTEKSACRTVVTVEGASETGLNAWKEDWTQTRCSIVSPLLVSIRGVPRGEPWGASCFAFLTFLLCSEIEIFLLFCILHRVCFSVTSVRLKKTLYLCFSGVLPMIVFINIINGFLF